MLISFFMCRNFSRGNFPLSRHDLKINSSGLQKRDITRFHHPNTYHIMTTGFIWVNVFDNIFRISSLVKRIVDSDSWVFFVKVAGRSLQVFIREHCFPKKVLNISAFLLMSMKNLFSYSNGGIQGIFLLCRNIFNIDQ